jgi:hypothetical protein
MTTKKKRRGIVTVTLQKKRRWIEYFFSYAHGIHHCLRPLWVPCRPRCETDRWLRSRGRCGTLLFCRMRFVRKRKTSSLPDKRVGSNTAQNAAAHTNDPVAPTLLKHTRYSCLVHCGYFLVCIFFFSPRH